VEKNEGKMIEIENLKKYRIWYLKFRK
jgi:hypothetical protein